MAESTDRRPVPGSLLWLQTLAFVVAMLVLVSGVGYAVVRWLQRTA